MVELTQQQLARQRKKIEKDRRRKVYDDLQVQGTNNSSIVSKRSIEKLYTCKLNPEIGEWFKYFVPNGKRRSPAINRGYWIRMESIKLMVLKIIQNNPNQKVQIINLGCGFDPLPFQLLNDNTGNIEYEFADIDFPDLILNKYNMIKQAQEILNIIGYEQDNSEESLGLMLSTKKCKLFGCDLKDTTKYQSILQNFLNEDSIKIFIAEVSLAYMEPKDANKIIEMSSQFKQTHFLILEQCLPQGEQNSFAQKMIYHFEHLRHPIKCINDYPKPQDQIKRFKNWFTQVEIANLFENWQWLIDSDLKSQIESIEEFDEWEEFIIFCHHYILCHSTNQNGSNQMIYPENHRKDTILEIDTSFTIDINQSLSNLNLKFPALTSNMDSIIIHGGLSQTRTSDTVIIKNNEKTIIQGPSPRMAHTMTNLNGKIILIGGRTRPGHDLNDVYVYEEVEKNEDLDTTNETIMTDTTNDPVMTETTNEKNIGSCDSGSSDSGSSDSGTGDSGTGEIEVKDGKNGCWKLIGHLPYGVSRHTSVAISNHQILILSNRGFIIFDIETHTSMIPETTIELKLSSCSIARANSYSGYIIGGMIDPINPTINNKLYYYTIQENKLDIKHMATNDLFARIGSQSHLINNDKLIIIGGVSTKQLFNELNTIVSYNIKLPQFSLIQFPNQLYYKYPPMLIGFATTIINNKIEIATGGAVCYSFGTVYNYGYTINIATITTTNTTTTTSH